MTKGQHRTRDEDIEWGGPMGALLMMVGLPVCVLVFCAFCDASGCPSYSAPVERLVAAVPTFFSWEALGVVLAWLAFHAVLYMVVPGVTMLGQPLEDGSRLDYRINGFWCVAISLTAVCGLHWQGVIDLAWVADNMSQLAGATIAFSLVMSTALYVAARVHPVGLAPHGNTGNVVYDFFVGHQLNPRIGSFDFKFFCELRPGLAGWVVINLALAVKQYQTLGTVTNSMVLVNLFEAAYVLDAVWFEHCILTTMDITTDGFGFMLVVGDLAWLPYMYSLQARYLAYNPVQLSPLALAGVLGVTLLGGYIFRASNWQKNAFRTNPNNPRVKHLKYLQTERGTKLLMSGWWGMSRHMNYLGDWLMGTGWCLPCGFGSPIPYFYSIYFAGLLIHRSLRDEHKCAAKYGKDWVKYCKAVPYRIVPYVY